MEKNYPWWVRVSIWGSYKRRTVKWFAVASIVVSILFFASLVYDLTKKETELGTDLGVGMVFFIIFLLYYYSMVWVDRNGNWENIREHWASVGQLLGATAMTIAVYISINVFLERIFS